MDTVGVKTFVRANKSSEVWPQGAIAISLRLTDGILSVGGPATARVALANADIVLAVDEDLCRHTFAIAPSSPTSFQLPADMRAIGMAIRDCDLPGRTEQVLHLAKSIELLCSIAKGMRMNKLVPAGTRDLTERDAQRIMTARHIIDERWQEKLTLASIARASGLNRAKLTRGFRSMFACSVADAIADRRMNGARQLILATDLPIASIGFRCGYLNNASFARAFSRRFGLAPTRLRAGSVAA